MNNLLKRIAIGSAIVGLAAISLPALATVSDTCKADLSTCTTEELTEYIADLSATLQALQSQLGTLQGTTPTTPTTPTASTYTGVPADFTFTKNLYKGMKDQDVVYLKKVLDVEVPDHASWSGSNYFGSKTKAAVVAFQNKYKDEISAAAGYTIKGSGFVGTGTRAQLNALLSVAPTPATPECTTDADCTTGYECKANKCVEKQVPAVITSVSPTDGATDVAVDTNITATFSVDLDAATVNTTNVKVTAGTTEVAGTVSYNTSTKVVTFDPTDNLAYSTAYTVTLSKDIKKSDGTDALTADYSSTFTTVAAPVAAGLTVELAEDTPVASTLVDDQALADLVHLKFTNGNDYDVKVTKLVLKRIGVSGDTTLENVYLYDGATRLTDAATVSQGKVTFAETGGIFTVAKGSSKTIAVKSDILTGTQGQTVGIQLAEYSDVTVDQGEVKGTYPISGNLMSIATATLAGVNFTGTTFPSTSNIDPATDIVVWQKSVAISERSVNLTHATFRMVGSINASDLNNFRLLVNGTTVATADALDANGYVTFAPATPYVLTTGTKTIKVMADVIGGSNRTLSFSLRNASDFGVVDSSYGVGIKPTVGGSDFSTITAGTLTVNYGSVTVQKASDSPSGDVTLDASDAVLAKYTLTAYGEEVKIETLKVGAVIGGTASSSIGSLRNGRLLIDGTQVGSTASLSASNSSPAGTSYTVNYTLTPGTPVTLEIRADIYDNDGTNNIATSTTITARLISVSNNAQGKVSAELITVPSSNQDGNQLTVTAGGVTLSKYSTYGNQTAAVPQNAYKIGHFVLNGSSVEDVSINTIQVNLSTTTAVTDLYVKYGTSQTTVKSTPSSSNSWSISYTLAKNATIDVLVYANLGATATTTTATVTISGTTVSSGQSVSASKVGQTISVGTASITSAVDASRPVSQLLVGNSTVEAAAFKFTTQYDSYTVTEITVTTTASGATAISNVILRDGTTDIQTKPLSGTSVTFSGLNISVAANSSKVLKIALQLGSVGPGAGSSGANVQVSLTGFKANNSQGVQTTNSNTRTANALYVYKTKPTITSVSLPSTTLGTGDKTIAKFSVAADSAVTVGFKKLIFTVSKSANVVIGATSTMKFYDADTNTQISGTFTASSTLNATGSVSGATIEFEATNEQEVSGTKTYYLQVYVSGSLASGDYINTNIAQPSSYVAPTDYSSVAATATFVWTDQSALSHDTTTSDWNNDYLVKNLPTATQVLEKK